MDWRVNIITGLLIMYTGIAGSAQTVDSLYEVGTWHGFRQTVINYTFDDGLPNQFNKVIPMFNEFNFDLTLFTVTNWTSDWARLQDAVDQGHEVASHSITHANFSELTPDQQRAELRDSKAIIENHIAGQQCITFAYPYCVTGVDSIVSRYYIAARGCQGFIDPSTPGSYMNVSSINCGSVGPIKTLAHFKTKFETAAASKGWLVFLLHAIDEDAGYSPIELSVLRSSLEYLNIRRSKFWVTTFRNAALYSQERNAASVTEITSADTLITLQVTDTLTDSIYHFPLTIRRPLPINWPSADVLQNSDTVPSRIVQVDTIVYLTFDAVPDAGEIKLLKNNTYVIPDIDTVPPDIDSTTVTTLNDISAGSDSMEVRFSDNTLFLKMPVLSDSEFTVRLYDLRGSCVFSRKVHLDSAGKTSIRLSKRDVSSGIYIVGVTDGRSSWSGKVLLHI